VAGVIAKRLRLTTSRKPSYRRGGFKIGTTSAPTYLEQHEASVGQLLAIARDPNITLAFEDEDGAVAVFTSEDRAEFEEGLLKVIEADGPDRTLVLAPPADVEQLVALEALAKSEAGNAVLQPAPALTEPTAQPDPPAPDPAPPAPKGRAKPKPVKDKP
jgi:hypothetical protein